ncbi:thioester-containing protein 1 allele R1-like [Ochlerotatus camptorhynchus]|uniref:thioester-containing protein 1 allele R1-like n=1 Tax=Ochlerotatus camptorhynchus TaxID=644619 RepID=UPI0031DF712A
MWFSSDRWFLVLVFGALIPFCKSQGLSIIGPKKIRPNTNYTVVLSNSLNYHARVQLSLENEDDLKMVKPIVVQRRSVQSIDFALGSIERGQYTLAMEGLDQRISLYQRVELDFEPKSMSVLIQTDKPVYKPGELLRFRIVVIDEDTRPVKSIQTVNIALDDSEETSIRKWPFARLYNGVFESAVQIASSPVLGNWTITVKASDDVIVTKQIELKEFVLPKFFVRAFPSKVLLVEDKKISIMVETAYTFGEPVDGTVQVDLYIDETSPDPQFSTTTRITGQTIVEFNLGDEADIGEVDTRTDVTAKITVTEAFSNRTMNITQSIPLYQKPYVVTAVPSSAAFRPGVAYPVQLVVKDHFGRPPSEGKPGTVQVRAEFDLPEDSDIQEMEAALNKHGEAVVVLDPRPNALQLSITATYDSIEYETSQERISGVQSQSKQYIKINRNPKYRVRANKVVSFDVSCTKTMTHFSYVVVARGKIVASSNVPVANKRKYTFKLKLLPEMAPEARIIVYYTNEDFLIFDDCELKFETFNNDFKFTLDKHQYTPGEDIRIDVYAAGDSYVAFSGIDQSVLLVGQERHNFNEEDVLKELSLYGNTNDDEFDLFHKWGLFLRSTSQIDSIQAPNELYRFGGSLLGIGKSAVEAIHIRTVFDESCLWGNYTMENKSTHMQITEYVPDTITTYYVSGFALSPTLGLGVVKQPEKFIVRKPFYMIANLPYSIKRGEVALIQVTVFNFLGQSVTTDVTLYNRHQHFDFVENTSGNPNVRTKTVTVPNNNGRPVSFMIKAKVLGKIAIKFQANSSLDTDSLEHMLRVTPESQRTDRNEPRFIELTENFGRNAFDFILDIPRTIDEGSAKIKFSLDPDILGKTIENLDGLIRKPSGCGEQNMINFVPNIVVLDYLSETGTVADHIRSKAINFLSSGYQNQLRYKRSDGAFSIWGQSSAGSTFLTAFVAKSLKIADKYINVDRGVVNKAFEWLASKQSSDGQFPEVGRVFSVSMQGGLKSTSYALTSYVLIAFGENEEVAEMYKSVVQKTAQYLVTNFENINDVYDLSLAAYGLSLIKHSKRMNFLNKLIENSIFADNATERYWNRDPVGVEVAGYALLSYIANDMFYDATPIMHWLNRQRYGLGGYAGTQDTFVGLKALAKFAAKMSGTRNDYRVRIYHGQLELKSYHIQKAQSMTIQEMDIPNHIRKLKIEVDGIGNGYFQVAYQYYHNIQVAKPSFDLEVKLLNTTTYNVQHLKVCVKYKPKEAYDRSNMALVETFFPSGMLAEVEAVKDITGGVKKTERRFSDTSVVVYYESLGSEEECFQVAAYRRFKVALHLPAYVVVYDYYHDDRFAIQKYEGKVLQLCDICEDEDCEILLC